MYIINSKTFLPIREQSGWNDDTRSQNVKSHFGKTIANRGICLINLVKTENIM